MGRQDGEKKMKRTILAAMMTLGLAGAAWADEPIAPQAILDKALAK